MRHLFPLMASIALSFTFFSCDPKISNETTVDSNEYVNDWILENMQTYYYWTEKLPAETDKTLSPDLYFESLLYSFDSISAPDGDRFSWIQDDWKELVSSLNGVVSNEIGFDYVLYLKEEGGTNVVGQVTYVKKGTPAALAGVKRGMWFDRVDGSILNTTNYKSLLTISGSQLSLGLLNENYTTAGAFSNFSAGSTLTFQTVSNYMEDPVYLDSVYTIGNAKIGYLVYNFFSPDGGTNNAIYDLEMNRVFGKFKNAGITDLIIDLRYNSGGHSASSQLLASLIVPELNESQIYTYYKYNTEMTRAYRTQYGSKALNTYFTKNVLNGETKLEAVNNVGANLNKRVYILTGQYTASASEQVINGLKPFMDVILIGQTTYGKNVASISIYEENDTKNTWGMQPIVAKYFNSLDQSDFTAGFVPKYKVNDAGLDIKPLGDTQENLLNVALGDALGLINTSSAVHQRSAMVQKNRQLKSPSHVQRGLLLDKLPQMK